MITLSAKINFSNGLVYELNNRNLISFDISSFEKSKIDLPSFGVVSNSASVSFNDYDRTVYNYIKLNYLKSNLTVTPYLTNLITKAKEPKGVWLTDKWEYDNNTNEVSVTLKDDLLEWQNISVGNQWLVGSKNMYEILELIQSFTPSKFEFEIDNDTKTYLQNITCNYPYLQNGSLWSQYDKLCQVCGLSIYKTFKNKVKIIHRV